MLKKGRPATLPVRLSPLSRKMKCSSAPCGMKSCCPLDKNSTLTKPFQKTNPDIENRLNLFRTVAKILERKRKRRGAIEFNLPETQFDYDAQNNITNVERRYQTPARRVIEQFMLEANENVAQYCRKNKIPIIWRNHPSPPHSKIKELQKVIKNSDLKDSPLQTSQEFPQIKQR